MSYCNRKCQSKHYKIHKEECWKLAKSKKKHVSGNKQASSKSQNLNSKNQQDTEKQSSSSKSQNLKSKNQQGRKPKQQSMVANRSDIERLTSKVNVTTKETSISRPKSAKIVPTVNNQYAAIYVDDSSDESTEKEDTSESPQELQENKGNDFQQVSDSPPLKSQEDIAIHEESKSKKKRRKKKKEKDSIANEDDLPQNKEKKVVDSDVTSAEALGSSKDICQESKAKSLFDCLCAKLEINSSSESATGGCQNDSFENLVRTFFNDMLWLLIGEDSTSELLHILSVSTIVPAKTKEWLKSQVDFLIGIASAKGRYKDMIGMIAHGGEISSSNILAVFQKLPKSRGNSNNNLIARKLASSTCKIQLESKEDIGKISRAINCRVGKQRCVQRETTLKCTRYVFLIFVRICH